MSIIYLAAGELYRERRPRHHAKHAKHASPLRWPGRAWNFLTAVLGPYQAAHR